MHRQWGEFKEVLPPSHRLYIRAYWRFLLSWGYAPKRSDIPAEAGGQLRARAKEEVIEYRRLAAEQNGAIIYGFEPPPPPSPPQMRRKRAA